MKEKCLIYIIDAPVPENISEDLKRAFGEERAAHLYKDMLSSVYAISKKTSISPVISYKKGLKFPDLTWLDDDDPGFLEPKSDSFGERVYHAFKWAFNAGAHKALMIMTDNPAIERSWVEKALDFAEEGKAAVGPAGEKIYFLGLHMANLDFIKEIDFSSYNLLDNILEKARRARIHTELFPESFCVKDEETLRKWLEKKDDGFSLFSREEVREHRKKHRRNHNRKENSSQSD